MTLDEAFAALHVVRDALEPAYTAIARLNARAEDAERELSKAAKRIVELEASRDALERELEREGDFVCPNDLRASNLERELAEARVAITKLTGDVCERDAIIRELYDTSNA